MSSITFWARLEPDPRSAAIEKGLAAQVRDPLWMLTRQWQFGEFLGEDAASPAYIKLATQRFPFTGWLVKQVTAPPAPLHTLAEAAPLEPVIEREPFSPHDLSLQVELGQTCEALLRQGLPAANWPGVIQAFRLAYPVESAQSENDQAASRFLSICAARAINGAALYLELKALAPPPNELSELPVRLRDNPAITPVKMAVITVLKTFIKWVEEIFGELSAMDQQAQPEAWLPERLEYGIEVVAAGPQGGQFSLAADPGRNGELDWLAFDLQPPSPLDVVPISSTVCVLPIHVHFQGMPNARWWDFEENTVDFGAITPDKTDLAKLVVADFMLIQGNDWFMIPYELELASLCRIDTLLVRDVFGGLTLVERADRPFIQLGERWTIFSTTARASETGLADFFILPASAFTAKLTGPILEEVRLMRDEMANMAWATEHTIENKIGEPQPGYERAVANSSAAPSAPPQNPGAENGPPLRYQIQTSVPTNWIPLLPVRINRDTGNIALELGAMLDQANNAIEPQGKLLKPKSSPYQIREEEVPRAGTRVLRRVNRVRWIDGTTHLWIAREKTVGQGEGASGLQFDLAILNP